MKREAEPYWHPSRKTVSHDDLMAFADRLHKRMVELGMTQADLARKAFGEVEINGITRVRDRDKVSLYLRGKGLPGADKMKALAKALEMPMTQLAPPISSTPREATEHKEASRAVSQVPPDMEGIRIEPSGRAHAIVSFRERLTNENAFVLYQFIMKLKNAG